MFKRFAGFTRRDILTTMGSSLILAAAPPFEVANPKPVMEGAASATYDLVVKGGEVIDPSQQINAMMDVALVSGKVARLAPDIPAETSRLSPVFPSGTNDPASLADKVGI